MSGSRSSDGRHRARQLRLGRDGLGQPPGAHRLARAVRHGRDDQPGGGHAFHRHPDQEEIIWVREGRDRAVARGRQARARARARPSTSRRTSSTRSYTVGDEPAKLSVILSPTAGEGGYEVIDVFEEEPWASLR